jgi:large subunit ribosomal protein L25
VTCLPADLPEFIAVDLSGLEKGQACTGQDIQLPKGVSARGARQKQPGPGGRGVHSGRRRNAGPCRPAADAKAGKK